MLKLIQQINNQSAPDVAVEEVVVAVEELELEGEVEAGNEAVILTIFIKFLLILVTSNLRPRIIVLNNGIRSTENNSKQFNN